MDQAIKERLEYLVDLLGISDDQEKVRTLESILEDLLDPSDDVIAAVGRLVVHKDIDSMPDSSFMEIGMDTISKILK